MPPLRLGQPFWLMNERPAVQSYSTLQTPLDTDLAVVGGGMTGATIAVVFARAGIRVALLEASLIGYGSTAASTALLLREPDAGMLELGRRYGARAARRIWQLSAEASRGFVRLLRQLRIECELTQPDSVYYTLEPDKVRQLQAECARRRRAGFPAEWLPSETLRHVGIPGRGGIRSRGNAQFNPFAACRGLMRAAADADAAVFERSRVEQITHDGDGVRLVTRRGSVRARNVVIATGYATPAFQPAVGRFRLHQTYVLATRPLGRHVSHELGLERVMLWDTERPYHYGRWTPDHRLLLGGADRPFVSRRHRQAAFRRGTRELSEYFEGLFPSLSGVGIDYAWDGIFATTPDGLPYIGRHTRFPRRLFALGYGGNGMTFGYLAAQILLEQWRGVESADHPLFGFGRFR